MAKFSSHSASTSLLSFPTSSNHFKRTSSSVIHFPQNKGKLTHLHYPPVSLTQLAVRIEIYPHQHVFRQQTFGPLVCIYKQMKRHERLSL
ncbi:unnamed protein product [Callosobruchus maculatus]|uniref:Uncharacterized protein n=1 Tax=Callosobruchus maculatus TaxID=64391 RepID=A0A653DWC4_CALMS|nr:unnamed protein product [Callosobruchus maculatus]